MLLRLSSYTLLAFIVFGITSGVPFTRPKTSRSQGLGLCDNSVFTLAGSWFEPQPDDFILSAVSFPLSDELSPRGPTSGDRDILWCCENSATYVTIQAYTQVRSDPSFDAVNTLDRAIKDVKAHVLKYGYARLPGGRWGFELDHVNKISAIDTGSTQVGSVFKSLNWPVLRDGLKALSDFIIDRNLTHRVRGLQFGINSAHLGQVGKGTIG